MLGCLHRFGAVELPGDLAVVANPIVMFVAIAMYCVEFIADKVPYIDTCWDIVHTFIRVPAGAALAASAFADYSPATRMLFVLLGGGIALSSHGSKAATRVLINASPEPFTNSIASTGEDGLAFGIVALAIFHPIIAIILVIGFIALTIYLLPKIIRLLIVGFRKLMRVASGEAPASENSIAQLGTGKEQA